MEAGTGVGGNAGPWQIPHRLETMEQVGVRKPKGGWSVRRHRALHRAWPPWVVAEGLSGEPPIQSGPVLVSPTLPPF